MVAQAIAFQPFRLDTKFLLTDNFAAQCLGLVLRFGDTQAPRQT